jgi:hypothetical protein
MVARPQYRLAKHGHDVVRVDHHEVGLVTMRVMQSVQRRRTLAWAILSARCIARYAGLWRDAGPLHC